MGVFRYTADITPGKVIESAKNMAVAPSCNVAGVRASTSGGAGGLLRSDCPKSPRSTPPMKCQYCT